MKKELMELSAIGGISGFEYAITGHVKDLLLRYCDEVSSDRMGNVIGLRKSKKENAKKVMLEAHIDGIGLMVKDIDERGFITFVSIGGVDTRILPSAEVIVCGKEALFGVIGAKPPHLQKAGDGEKTVKIEDMAIDVGLPADKVRRLVSVGDMITFSGGAKKLLGKTISGKYMDDRAGLVSLLICLDELKDTELDFDLVVLAAVQEEVGCRGAVMGTFSVEPDYAFVVDVCHGDTPDSGTDSAFTLGTGTVISLGPNIHPLLAAIAKNAAKENKIAHSIDVDGGETGTDAWEVQVSKKGVPTLLLSIPLRYMHTTVETLSFDDVNATGKLLAACLTKINQEAPVCTFQI